MDFQKLLTQPTYKSDLPPPELSALAASFTQLVDNILPENQRIAIQATRLRMGHVVHAFTHYGSTLRVSHAQKYKLEIAPAYLAEPLVDANNEAEDVLSSLGGLTALGTGFWNWTHSKPKAADSSSGLSIWTYLFGTQPVTVALERKDLHGTGLPSQNLTADKMRVNLGPLSLAGETSSNGHRRFDVRVGARPGGVGVAISPGEGSVLRPYGRLGWMQLRVKYYPDHVSLKVETTSRVVNGMGKATEIRMTKPEWAAFKNLLQNQGEIKASDFLKQKYGVNVSGLRRLTSIAHGAGGLLAELGLFVLVGKGIDGLAEKLDFDPNFAGRGIAQVGSTLVLAQLIRILWHKIKTGDLPGQIKERMTCATIDTAATMMAFDMAGNLIDGTASKYGFDPDFFGRTALQFIAAYMVVIAAKQKFADSMVGQMCSAQSGHGLFDDETANKSKEQSKVGAPLVTPVITGNNTPPLSAIMPAKLFTVNR